MRANTAEPETDAREVVMKFMEWIFPVGPMQSDVPYSGTDVPEVFFIELNEPGIAVYGHSQAAAGVCL